MRLRGLQDRISSGSSSGRKGDAKVLPAWVFSRFHQHADVMSTGQPHCLCAALCERMSGGVQAFLQHGILLR